jgi:hypothetical protein
MVEIFVKRQLIATLDAHRPANHRAVTEGNDRGSGRTVSVSGWAT